MKANYRQIPDLLKRRTNFEGNSMRGKVELATSWGLNRCGRGNTFPDGTYGYVVWSYDTPIAAVRLDTDEAVIPDIQFSVTTSRQQNLCRAYL